MSKKISRLVMGSLSGAALVAGALALAPSSAFAIECTETASAVCCESSTGKVSCFAKRA
jgi:hypothetical protein